MLIPFGVFSAVGAGGRTDFELISTTVLGSSGSVSFTSIPQIYKHLQIRAVARTTASQVPDQLFIRANNDTTADRHGWHYLNGNGSSVTSGAGVTNETGVRMQMITGANATTNSFGAVIVDILDYASTSKNKTFRGLGGYTSATGSEIGLSSGFYESTSAITQLDVFGLFLAMAANTRISLYGIRG